MDEILIDKPCFGSIAAIVMAESRIPDQARIFSFRALLEEHRISEQSHDVLNQILRDQAERGYDSRLHSLYRPQSC